jgi:predicted O-linked N-acetylglucosamine transferase (SPINDLY family)
MPANNMSMNIDDEIEHAYALATSGQLDESEIAYLKLLEQHPDEPRILSTLGAIALRKDKLSEAKQLLSNSLKLDSEQAKPWLNLSAVLFRLGDYASALNAVDRAQSLGFDGAETWNNRGVILNALNKPEEALLALNTSLTLSPTYAEALYNKATVLQKIGHSVEAVECYKAALELSPNHLNALFNLSILQGNQHAYSQALDNLGRAISLHPGFVEALINRGAMLLDIGRIEEALEDTEKAIEFAPNHAKALFQKANILLMQEDPEGALTFFSRVKQIDPQDTRNLIAMGVAYFDLEDFNKSISTFDEALALDPNSAEAHNNKGLALQQIKLYEVAIKNYRRALELKPNYTDALFNCANALRELDAFEDSLALYENLLDIDPEYVAGWKNMGATLDKLKRRDEALKAYERAIYLSPANADAYFNASTVLVKLNKLELALRYANKALKLDPDYVETLYIRALILMQLGLENEAKTEAEKAIQLKPRHALANDMLGTINVELKNPVEALACYEIAIAEKNDIDCLPGKIAHLKMQLSDWWQYENSLNNLLASIDQEKVVCQPFELHSLIDSPEIHKKSAQIFYGMAFKKPEVVSTPFHEPNKRIHIAYFSSDIGSHPVANLMVGVLEAHNKDLFEISVFSLVNQSGPVRDRVFKASERFINAEFMNDEKIVSLARSLKVDIAIDLNGYTGKNRTSIFELRVAPVQINYIGFLGTMGSRCHDYILADPVMAPIEHEAYFTEKIIQLPCYQANDDKLEVPPTVHSRADFGLPEDAFVFCSFNGNYKITPEMFSVWMRVLQQLPESVLWLHGKTETAINNLRQSAKSLGISGDRLIFARTLPYSEHLARQRLADLFLDTHPYNAGATASNALYCGLPLVTLLGRSFCSRYGGSLLTALDLPELITHSTEEYLALCIRLATDKMYHSSIKQKLESNVKDRPLFNTSVFTRNFEKAIQIVHTRHQERQHLKHITPADLLSE